MLSCVYFKKILNSQFLTIILLPKSHYHLSKYLNLKWNMNKKSKIC